MYTHAVSTKFLERFYQLMDKENSGRLTVPELLDAFSKLTWYCMARNFWGRKLFRISRFCGYLRTFSLQNFGAWCLLAAPVRKVFYVKITNSRKFSPVKVSCYTICSVNCPNSYMDISYVHNYSSHTNTAWTEMLNGWPGLSNSSQWLLVATDRLIFKNLKMLFMWKM